MRVHVILRNSLILLSLAALALWQVGCGDSASTTAGKGTSGGSGSPKVSTGAPADESTSTDSSDGKKPAASKSNDSDDENMEIEDDDAKGAEKSEPGDDDEQAGSTTGGGRDVPEAAPEEE